jgi:hypothetical protein
MSGSRATFADLRKRGGENMADWCARLKDLGAREVALHMRHAIAVRVHAIQATARRTEGASPLERRRKRKGE